MLLLPQALTLPQKRVDLKRPREPLLVVLPRPVVLTSTLETRQATQTPTPSARTRSWAQVAAGVPPEATLSKRPRGPVQPSGHEEEEVIEVLSSVLADEKGEDEHFEDVLASALNA
eukprot:COSAG02_NODE_4092_length_5795_cov_4.106390_2_plen_116_part_00